MEQFYRYLSGEDVVPVAFGSNGSNIEFAQTNLLEFLCLNFADLGFAPRFVLRAGGAILRTAAEQMRLEECFQIDQFSTARLEVIRCESAETVQQGAFSVTETSQLLADI